jgi:wingless-type MMTV integration site family protein 11
VGHESLRSPRHGVGGQGTDRPGRGSVLSPCQHPDCPQALRASLETKCKCHGVSGSCSIRTCWKGLQELQDVAADLKTRYLSATKVVHRPMGTRKHLVPKDLDIRPVKDSELVYLQSSPDFCMKNEKVGSHGTQDR